MRQIATLALTALAALTTLAVAGPDRAAAVALSCASFNGPDCGGADGDATCGPGLECIETNNGCECQRRACCRCAGVPGGENGACDIPCEDATIDDIECAGQCLNAVGGGAACILTVMVDKQCADGNCVPTGCCAVTISTDGESTLDICVMTDLNTCTTAPDEPGTFIPGGRCDGGVTGTCVPTQANGTPCTSPTECLSGFCADDVCCNTACDGPGQCNLPGQVGTCAAPAAPAPALGPPALVVATTLIAGIAGFALRRRRAAFNRDKLHRSSTLTSPAGAGHNPAPSSG